MGEVVTAEIDSWPLDREFPIHARMQAVTLEVILRAVFGVGEGPRLDRLRLLLRDLLVETGSARLQLTSLVARQRGRDPDSGAWALPGGVVAPDETLEASVHRQLETKVDVREVDMPGGGDELDSPYVTDEVLDLANWARDALALALPSGEQVLCRPDCAGMCPVCGEKLAPGEEHEHERPPDPRCNCRS